MTELRRALEDGGQTPAADLRAGLSRAVQLRALFPGQSDASAAALAAAAAPARSPVSFRVPAAAQIAAATTLSEHAVRRAPCPAVHGPLRALMIYCLGPSQSLDQLKALELVRSYVVDRDAEQLLRADTLTGAAPDAHAVTFPLEAADLRRTLELYYQERLAAPRVLAAAVQVAVVPDHPYHHECSAWLDTARPTLLRQLIAAVVAAANDGLPGPMVPCRAMPCLDALRALG
jgi:hypothetical protein